MIIWDNAQTIFQKWTNDVSASTLTQAKLMMNVGYKEVLAEFDSEQIQKTKTASTVASQQAYKLPQDYMLIHTVTATIDSTKYTIIEEESQEMWDLLNEDTRTSTVPEIFFIRERFGVRGAELMLYPTPTDANTTLTVTYFSTARDLEKDEETSGTIALTNASSAVVGTSTAFSSAMEGRYLISTDDNSDGNWYRIVTVTNSTNLTLENVYGGTTDSSAAYKIVEAFALPEDLQILPIYFAAAMYYSEKKDEKEEKKYMDKFDKGLTAGKKRYRKKSRNSTIKSRKFFNRFGDYPRNFPSDGVS